MGCCSSENKKTINTATLPSPKDTIAINALRSPIAENSVTISFNNPKTPTVKGSQLISKFEELIRNKDFSQITKICRSQIQKNIDQDIQIDGMGNYDQALCYYQWNKFEWYADKISKGEQIGTVYDLLSLCELQLKKDDDEIQNAMEWYREMIDQYPQKYQILYGYANILYSKQIFQEASYFYNRVIEIKPNWTMPYECLAFTYKFYRIEHKKAIEMTEKLMKIQQNNRVGMYIAALNEKDVQTKIQKLKEASLAFPCYSRVINQIGITYGAKKNHRESIKWFKKCIQNAPQFANCYNNIAVNHHLLRQYDEALTWYFRAIERDKQDTSFYRNLSRCIDTLNHTGQKIKTQVAKYNIPTDYFYLYLGIAYADNQEYKIALKYYFLAQQNAKLLKKQLFKLYNSIGVTYSTKKKYIEAIQYFKKTIQLNPKYRLAYFNAALVYQKQDKITETIEWYKKAIQANHRESDAYNNLGTGYQKQKKYEKAIKFYKQAVRYCSTKTLAYANLGICYLKLQQYREAFNAMARANQLLPTDNNDLDQGNKDFLFLTLQKFEKQGQIWRQSGGITAEQKQKLDKLIKSFQNNFKTFRKQAGDTVSRQRAFRSEITQIIKLIAEDRFELKNIDKIYDLVRSAFLDNTDYFHILPQLFLQYFMNHTFKNGISVLQTETQLIQIVKRLSAKAVAEQPQPTGILKHPTNKSKYDFRLQHFNPPSECKVNLFQNTKFFKSYQELYAEIMEVNKVALAAYQSFKSLVDQVRKQSYGIPYGVSMKIPKQERDQFKVILRIYQKMFKKEINNESVKQIITKIEQQIKKKQQKQKEIGFTEIVLDIMQVWTQHISEIVIERRKNKVETVCQISDLLRGKVMFDTLDRLRKALQVTDQLCFQNGFEIIEMENRLAKPQTQDVVLKILVQDAVCQLQLAMNKDKANSSFDHSIYEIERSPLGCIFGSYIYLSKRVNYHIVQNCKDILTLEEKEGSDVTLEKAAKYIVEIVKID